MDLVLEEMVDGWVKVLGVTYTAPSVHNAEPTWADCVHSVGKTGSKISGSPQLGRNIDSVIGYLGWWRYLWWWKWNDIWIRAVHHQVLTGQLTFCQRLQNHVSFLHESTGFKPGSAEKSQVLYYWFFTYIGYRLASKHLIQDWGCCKPGTRICWSSLNNVTVPVMKASIFHIWLLFAAVRHLSSCCSPSMICSSRSTFGLATIYCLICSRGKMCLWVC